MSMMFIKLSTSELIISIASVSRTRRRMQRCILNIILQKALLIIWKIVLVSMADFQKKLYPNCDSSVWLRSCEEEVDEPLEGKITGRFLSTPSLL